MGSKKTKDKNTLSAILKEKMKCNINFHFILRIQNDIILLNQQWGFTKAPNLQRTIANMANNALTYG